MDSDVSYVANYRCPRCRLELEIELGGWQGWMRCPACDTPSLPPEILLGHPDTRRRLKAPSNGDATFADADLEPTAHPAPIDAADLIDEPPSSTVGTLRLLFVTGLVIALFILLVSFLDDNQIVTASSAIAALVFFLLMLRLPGRRRRRP